MTTARRRLRPCSSAARAAVFLLQRHARRCKSGQHAATAAATKVAAQAARAGGIFQAYLSFAPTYPVLPNVCYNYFTKWVKRIPMAKASMGKVWQPCLAILDRRWLHTDTTPSRNSGRFGDFFGFS
ncbi:Hypothetical predicted protein [Olea europaea subsp. europaea]|uniref:Uncharacterized protein n=1 Tax=Olea europaea subsp. europaea TaxID=158383 RepID=A0A8S0VM62_OLEEU|nr:Hypothetical predicted protein [Olea europaea subsp. europaea]